MLGDHGPGQSVQTAAEPLQLASLVKPEQELRRPAVLAHVRSSQHAPVQGQFEDVVRLVHEGGCLISALLLLK